MKKSQWIQWIDVLALIAFLLMVMTGILLYSALPPGSGRYVTFWAMNRHQWGDVHFALSGLFLLILVIHLGLHWRFIRGIFQGLSNFSRVLKSTIVISLVVAILWIVLVVTGLLGP